MQYTVPFNNKDEIVEDKDEVLEKVFYLISYCHISPTVLLYISIHTFFN